MTATGAVHTTPASSEAGQPIGHVVEVHGPVVDVACRMLARAEI